MSRPILLACAALVTLACGEKKEPASSADAATDAPAAAEETSSTLPQDKASKAFTTTLVDLEITRFSPTDDGVLKYDSLSFEADATWSASAAIEIVDERMDCTESGAWSMEPATSDTSAAITWSVDSTNCAGREAGDVQRVLVELELLTFDVSFR